MREMWKRCMSLLLAVIMLTAMAPAFVTTTNAFDIDKVSGASLYYAAANFARLTENTNIFSAQYYGVDSVSSNSADSRLRERSTTMVYSHLAEIEKNSTSRAVFHDVWAALNADTDKFSGLTETDFYSGVLWAMMVGDMNASQKPVEAKMEDFEGVANGMIMEFAEWYCVDVARETSTEKAKEVLEDWEKEDASLLETVQIWYGDHYSTIAEEIEGEKSFFKNVDDVFEKGSKVMQFCGTAIEYITKMSQLEALYGMSHDAYLSFLKALSAEENIDPQLKIAADNLIVLMNSDNYQNALDDYLLQLVCHDGMELALDKVSDILKDVAENALSKVSSNAIAGGVLLGVKLGMEAANLLLGVEDKLAIRYNILLLSSMTDSVFDASKQLRTDYYSILPDAVEEYLTQETINAELGEAADAYVASIEMCYRFLLQTDTYASQYVNENYNDWWNSSKETFNTYNNTIEEEIDGLTSSYDRLASSAQKQYSMYYDQLVNNIIYKADGWENVSLPTRKEYWIDVTITLIVPTKEGYKFEGWIDNATGKIYESGSSFTANYSEDTILEPLWTYDAAAKVPASFDEAKGMVDFSTSVASATAGRIRYMAQVTSDSYFVSDYWKYTANGTTGTISPGDKCTRCALSMALSYLGLDYTPGYMSTLYGSSNIPSPLVDVPAKIAAVSRVDGSNFDLLWSNYAANVNYTPVVLYFDYLHPNDNTMHEHAILVIGQNGNTYYAVDSAANQTHLVEFTFNADKSAIATCSYARYASSSKIKSACQWKLTGTADQGTCVVNFHANKGAFGNTAIVKTQTANNGSALILNVEEPKRTGYQFAGWSKSANGTGTVYKTGETLDISGATDLYAVWTDAEAAILYDYGDDPTGKNVTMERETVDTSAGAVNYTVKNVKEGKETYNGNSFKGWIVQDPNGKLWWANAWSDNGKYTLYQPGQEISLSGDMEFYGKWTWFAHYDYGDGKYVHTEVGDAGFLYVSDPVHDNAGKTFSHWSCTEANGKTVNVRPGQRVSLSSDVYLTAVWSDLKLSLSGTITDATSNGLNYGEKVVGVTVEFFDSDGVSVGKSTTDSTGTFSFTFAKEDTYKLVFSKVGYNTKTVSDFIVVKTTPSMGNFTMTQPARNIIADGTCGANLTWALDDEGLFTVSGEGAMDDYYNNYDSPLPWKNYKEQIVTVVIGDNVTKIGFSAFEECDSLQEVHIGKRVTCIGGYSFAGTENLRKITVPDNLNNTTASVGGYAFEGANIAIVIVPKTVISVPSNIYEVDTITEFRTERTDGFGYFDDDGILYYKDPYTEIQTLVKCPQAMNLTETYTVLSGTHKIGNKAFYNKDRVKNVVLPTGLTSVGEYAFYDCDLLETIRIPDTVTSIGQSAFYNCDWLNNVYMGKALTGLGHFAFSGCGKLTTITVPDKLAISISPGSNGGHPFYNSAVKTVIVPATATSVSENLYNMDTITEFQTERTDGFGYFDDDGILYYKDPHTEIQTLVKCPQAMNLTETYTVLNGTHKIGNKAFYNKDRVKNVVLPTGLTSVGEYAFYDCDLLETIRIPDTATSIGQYAFYSCDWLNNVYIGKSVTALADYVFNSCGKLVNIYFRGSAPSIRTNTFKGLPGAFTIYYKDTASGWSTPKWQGYLAYPYAEEGTAGEYQINSISLKTDDGTAMTEIPKAEFKATVSITNRSVDHEDTMVMLAAYTASGKFKEWMAVSVEDCPIGATVKVTLPVNNKAGDIAVIKAFTVSTSGSLTPLGDAVVFPAP